MDRPDVRGRESILKVHTKKTPLADDVDLSVIARGTPGFAGAQHRDYSEETAIRIDQQVRKLVEDGYNMAKQIIQQRSDALVRIAEALLEREVLDGAEVLDLINGKPLPKVAAGQKTTTTTPPDGGTVIAPHPSGPLPGLVGGESPQPA